MKMLRVAVGFVSFALMAFGQAQDFTKIEIKANRISEKFYTLDGVGGTIGVLIGPDGVLMVDTQFGPLSEKIVAAVRKLSDQPIRYVINTHVHGDHTGGNVNFGKLGATLISREEVRFRLEHPNPLANGQAGVVMAAAGLPKQTYRERLNLFLNGEEVQLVAMPRGHTDGDTMIVFPGLDVIMTGDYYRSIQYPVVDRANGGSVAGLIEALGQTIAKAGPNTKIIPGHGPVVDKLALIAHRGLVMAVRDRVAALLNEGKRENEVVAANVTADLDAKILEPGTSAERFVRQVYADLRANGR